MPRQARIDTPGALHHVICRGIERRNIFRDNTDRNRFLERLGSVLQKTSTPCYGWALIPNHFHLLLKTGKEPIAQIMRRLLTGYAVTFNPDFIGTIAVTVVYFKIATNPFCVRKTITFWNWCAISI